MTHSYRLLIHWQNFPAYAAACVSELRQCFPVETLVLFNRVNVNAPFDREQYKDVGEVHDITGIDQSALNTIMEQFAPSAALVGGWVRYARMVAASAKKQGIPVIAASDIIHRNSFRQRLFPLYHQLVLKKIHDYYWVPGQKAKEHLSRNHIPSQVIWEGLYSPNISEFNQASALRQEEHREWPQAFLFIGQYIDRKGVPELLDAFERANTNWKLLMCGDGPLKDMVTSYAKRSGKIMDLGFVQPEKLPRVMAQAGSLVLPSRQENWGLVIHEGAASGLPVICSSVCGAAYDLVMEGKNGFTVPPGNIEALTVALERMANLSQDQLQQMSQESLNNASRYSPEKWATHLYHKLTEIVKDAI